MSKTVSKLCLVERDEAPELPELSEELRLQLAEVADAAREGLLAMSVAVGLRVMAEMMEDELTAKVGPKHAKIPIAARPATPQRRARWCSGAGGSRLSGPGHAPGRR